MFKNWKANNARRVDFSPAKILEVGKSKWGYLRNTFVGSDTTQDGEPTPDNPVPIIGTPYDDEITVCGENIFLKKNNAIANGTVEVIDDFVRCTGNIEGHTTLFAFSEGWYRPNVGLPDYGFQPKLKLGDTISVSADVRLIEERKAPAAIRMIVQAGAMQSANSQDLNLIKDKWVRISRAWSIAEGFIGRSDFYPVFMLNSNIVDIKNIAIKYGTDDTYTPYIGTTTPYTVEGLDGTKYTRYKLPDGTEDEVGVDNNLLLKNTNIKKLNGSESGWELYLNADVMDDYIRFINDIAIVDRVIANNDPNGTSGRFLCTHFAPGRAWSDYDAFFDCFSFSNATQRMFMKINKSELTGYAQELGVWQKVSLFRTWLSENPIDILYVCEPQIIPLKPLPKIPTIEADKVYIFNSNGTEISTNAISYGGQ